MDRDVKAARDLLWLARNDDQAPTLATSKSIKAMWTLARQWLAEHPADDSDLITEEWLRSVGFVEPSKAGWSGTDDLATCDLWLGEAVHWRRHDGEIVVQPVQLPIWRGVVRGWPKTRGALRLLLQGLGIPPTK